MQIGLKMEAGDCPTLNMNAMENYLLSHSLTCLRLESTLDILQKRFCLL